MRRRPRAIALILVLVVTTLMMLLLGAFLQVHRHHFGFMNSGSQREAAERACVSALEYSFFRLQHNKSWGEASFEENVTDSTMAPWVEATEIADTRRIEGTLSDLGATFQVDISNNLAAASQNAEGVPAYGCRLQIRATVRDVTQSHEAILVVAPLFDGGAVSSGGIDIESGSLEIASVDDRRNQIRSKGDIHVPRADRLSFAPNATGPDKGLIWSQSDITLAGRSVSDPRVLARAIEETGARFVAGALNNYEIHDLQIDDIRTNRANGQLKPGLYTFAWADLETAPGVTVHTKILQRRTRALSDEGFSGGNLVEFYYCNTDAPPGAKLAGTSMEGKSLTADAAWLLDGLVKVNFTTDEMWIDQDADIFVDGDFGLASYQDSIVPKLRFGELSGGVSDGKNEKNASSIRVEGDIGIEGPIEGTGKLLAGGNVHLRPNYADVEGDTLSDLSIYAGKDILIRPALNWGVRGDLRFRGLLYAAENLNIETRDGQKLVIRGAAVARNGKIVVRAQDSEVVLRYDPAYVDTLVKELPENRVRLERALWKD